jgi:hypothetical protein
LTVRTAASKLASVPVVRWRSLVVLALAAVLPLPVRAALRDHDAVPPEWKAAITAYGLDPTANRAALEPIMKVPLADLPELYLVAVADAQLRAGRPRAAVRAYRELHLRDAGPLSALADLALGTLALELGETAGVRDSLVGLLGDPGPNGALARLLLAVDDAGDGRTEEAIGAFEQLAGDPNVLPGVRSAARLGAGYARWWAGQYEAAVAAFDLAANAGDPLLADDARYAAARPRRASPRRAGDDQRSEAGPRAPRPRAPRRRAERRAPLPQRTGARPGGPRAPRAGYRRRRPGKGRARPHAVGPGAGALRAERRRDADRLRRTGHGDRGAGRRADRHGTSRVRRRTAARRTGRARATPASRARDRPAGGGDPGGARAASPDARAVTA